MIFVLILLGFKNPTKFHLCFNLLLFGANPLSGGYTFTGNSSNNGGSIITGDDKGNLFFITRGTNGSNTMTPTQTAANVKLFIKNDGNIGIGTSTPTAKLQISSGNISVDNGKVSIGTNTLANHEQLGVRGGQITTKGFRKIKIINRGKYCVADKELSLYLLLNTFY